MADPVVDRNLLLHLDGTPHCPVDAIEHDEQGVATGLDDPAAVLIDRRVYQVPTEGPQSFESSWSSRPMSRLYPTMSA